MELSDSFNSSLVVLSGVEGAGVAAVLVVMAEAVVRVGVVVVVLVEAIVVSSL